MANVTCRQCGEVLDGLVCPRCGTSQTSDLASQPPSESPALRFRPVVLAATAVSLAIAGTIAAVLWNHFQEDETAAGLGQALPPMAETRPKAELGDPKAQVALGDIYSEGKQVRQDYAEAAAWYRKAAEHGDSTAQYKIGVLHDIGQGVAKDETEAAKWYLQAAEQGNSDAQYTLAGMYGLGRGVPRNPAEALRWYRRAAELGDPLACFNLAERYERGRDVPTNALEAFKWHSLAAERGLPDAAAARDRLKHELSAAQRDQAQKQIREFDVQHPIKQHR